MRSSQASGQCDAPGLKRPGALVAPPGDNDAQNHGGGDDPKGPEAPAEAPAPSAVVPRSRLLPKGNIGFAIGWPWHRGNLRSRPRRRRWGQIPFRVHLRQVHPGLFEDELNLRRLLPKPVFRTKPEQRFKGRQRLRPTFEDHLGDPEHLVAEHPLLVPELPFPKQRPLGGLGAGFVVELLAMHEGSLEVIASRSRMPGASRST